MQKKKKMQNANHIHAVEFSRRIKKDKNIGQVQMKEYEFYPLLESIKNLPSVSNLEIEKQATQNDSAVICGGFSYLGVNLSFFSVVKRPLVVTEISLLFKFEKVKYSDDIDIYKAVNEFNEKVIGQKAIAFELDREKKEIAIDFTVENIFDLTYVEKNKIDSIAEISVLIRAPHRFSKILKARGIDHDEIEADDI